MNAMKRQFTWKRAAALGILLLLLPVAMLYASPGPTDTEVSLVYSSWSVNEKEGTVTITVGMLGEPTAPVNVTVSTTDGGTAVPGVNYQPNSQMLCWQPSEVGIEKSFTIVILDSGAPGPTTTVNLGLSNLSTNATFGNYPTAVLNIMNDNTVCDTSPTRK
jgi:hypothetical protein